MQENKIKLIYIASNGRSGSTLLDLLMGAHSNVWTLGEFQILPWEIKTPRQVCGCGKPVLECDFWAAIIQNHKDILLNGTIHRFRHTHQFGRVIRWDEIPFFLVTHLKQSATRERAIKDHGIQNAIVMRNVLEKAREHKGQQVSWLVDASKDHYRLMWLYQSGIFDIRVIHIVKEPRAFVYSMTKKDSGWLQIRKSVRMAGRYIVENYLIDRVFAGTVRRHTHWCNIRYEDLARRPENTLQMLCEWLRLPPDPDICSKFRGLQHGISGNDMRYKNTPIELDENWKQNLPILLQKVIYGMTFFSARKYGYH